MLYEVSVVFFFLRYLPAYFLPAFTGNVSVQLLILFFCCVPLYVAVRGLSYAYYYLLSGVRSLHYRDKAQRHINCSHWPLHGSNRPQTFFPRAWDSYRKQPADDNNDDNSKTSGLLIRDLLPGDSGLPGGWVHRVLKIVIHFHAVRYR